VPGETCFRGVAPDSTFTAFFATNYCNSHVYKFDVAIGTVLMAFRANSPAFTVKSVLIKPGTAPDTRASGRCRFTGGGNLPGLTGAGLMTLTNVTHGFEIHCNAGDLPNNIEVNWNSGDHFHLTTLVSVSCTDNPGIIPENPAAPCDTITGTGIGRYDGVDGATIQFTFTDAGEPGTNDTAIIRIYDASGNQVLDTNSTLTGGNQQAHGG